MSEDILRSSKESDRKRLYKLVDQALESLYDDEDDRPPPSLRMDTAALVATYVWEDQEAGDGSECEGVSVYSESKRPTLVRGLLERGIDRLKGAAQTGW
jgi:hypothetical protein